MGSQPSKPGLTRVEVVVIILCLLMLGALLLPAIQSTGERRPGPRQMCNNNLKGVVLALQAYHEYHRTFPMGAMHAGVSPGGDPPIDGTLGPSWWFGVLPFAENRVIHDQIMQTQRPGGPERQAFCADDMNAAGIPLDRFVPEYMRCLSSPLPLSESVTGPILLPTYVGISGGCDIAPDSSDYPPDVEGPYEVGGSGLRKMLDTVVGSGHPTVYPDNRHLLTDTYTREGVAFGDGTIPLRWIDLQTATERTVVRINTEQSCKDSVLRIDPHPAWDRTWRYVTFNAFVNGTRRVFIADMQPLID